MSAELRTLPVSPSIVSGEALDGYLERLAAANGMSHPHLLLRLQGAPTIFLTTAPDERVLAGVTKMSSQPVERLSAGTLATLPGIDVTGLDPRDRSTWRTVAARGWPPEYGTALCPTCWRRDGIWRLAWRHPWVTACAQHDTWLTGHCPRCRRRFRSHRTPLRPVDAPATTCGNPGGVRGSNCPQPLDRIPAEPAPPAILETQQRIDAALAGATVTVLGQRVGPEEYLDELKALAALLLHLAIQPEGDRVADWAHLAHADHERSPGGRGARWGLAPPIDLRLRGSVLASADAILRQPSLEAAADHLHSWTELTPHQADGQLGWLADHTTMTPALTRLVMAATATRRRVSTLLDHDPPTPCSSDAIPQVVPVHLYDTHVAGMLDVTARTGRLFTALCLARRHGGASTWAEAAEMLGLPGQLGENTARACSADLLVAPDSLVAAVDDLATQLDTRIDYRSREDAVRRLATTDDWYRPWARSHHPGSRDTSHGYAVTWLWTEYAHGHLDASPGWPQPPGHNDRARYRRYAARLDPDARQALTALARTTPYTTTRRTS